MPSPRTAPTSGWRTSSGNSVTELNASTGALGQGDLGVELQVRTIPMPSPRTAPTSGWRTRLAATRSPSSTPRRARLVKVISGSSYGFDDPDAIASDGTHVWVANARGNSGHRAPRLDGAPGPGDLGLELPVQRSRSPSPRTAPTSGWRTAAATRSPSSTPRRERLVQVISGSSYGFDAPMPSPRTAPRLGGERGRHSVTELTFS